MERCTQDGCTGHLGKFPDCLTEALWEVSMFAGDSTGNTEAYGHYTLIHVDGDESHTMGADLGAPVPGPVVSLPAGWYMVCTNDQGFVWLESWAASEETEATSRFADLDHEYCQWLEINPD